ncbi:MAG: peptidylprolyl isomerase [Candidatus Altiarchaeota archaeon]
MVSEVHAAHILVKSLDEAQSILNELKSGKSFHGLAQAKSLCSSAKKGGDLGWFTRGRMVKEFENTAFALRKGEMSAPVRTQFGWHIIKTLETR